MSTVELRSVSKVYPDGTRAVDNVSLEVATGTTMVLLGPSGCGKSTLLRMVAGLEDVSSGTIAIDDKDIGRLPPGERGIGFVFQDYALYPHMTVSNNLEFTLRMHSVRSGQRQTRAGEVASFLGLAALTNRRPAALSGGQQQRVAIGRAIVREPHVMLLDEPLSNLDANLRSEMRVELSRIQREVGATAILVTHDQTEAMSTGDAIAVLDGGRVRQVGTALDLYDRPANLFVASFIGSPPIILTPGFASGPTVHLSGQRLNLPRSLQGLASAGEPVIVGLRPSDLTLASDQSGSSADAGGLLTIRVETIENLGNEVLCHFTLPIDPAIADIDTGSATAEFGAARRSTVALPPRTNVRPGDRLRFEVDPLRLHLFDPRSGERLDF